MTSSSNPSNPSNLELIRRVPIFALLPPHHVSLLAKVADKHRFNRGALLVEQGMSSDTLYILLSGTAYALITDDKGREVIVATYNAGDYVGELGLLDNVPQTTTVRVERRVDVLSLQRHVFVRCLNENIDMAHSVLCVLARRLQLANEKISSLALSSVYERVAKVLMDLAVADENKQGIIHEKVSRQNVAKMVGASREMVSRVMKDFEKSGFVKVLEQGKIQVIDRRKRIDIKN
ncbi:MAG: hypothetical protein RIR79_437 [Pseudomonadota bacterium]|jgi:CRP-like cAMP-binding protein